MGGRSSEISAGTSRVLLEAAHFLPVAVGRTARHVGLRSEASYRFERGLDPEGVERSSARVCELIVQAATAAGVPPPLIARGLLDAHPVRLERTRISVRPARVNALLGTELSAGAMAELLEPIGYSVTAGESTQTSLPALEFVVPSFRPDVRREVDVAEDVARTFGYRHITGTDRRSPYVGRLDEIQLLRRRLRRVLCGFGAHEAWTSSIVDPADQARAGWDRDLVRLMNPMVAEESALRAGLLAGLLTAVRYNSGHRHPSIRLFEVGDVFVPSAPGRSAEADGEAGSAAETGLPIERERVALILAWSGDGADTAVQAWRVLADALALTGVEVLQGWAAGADAAKVGTAAAANHGPVISLAGLHGARSGVLVAGGGSPGQAAPIGTIGEVDPDVIASFGLPHERIGWLELDVASLAAAPRRPLLAEPVSRYPSSDVDLAFTVDEAVPAARVESVLREAAGELCESVELFDVYSRPGVDEGRRSLAYRVRFCAFDRTLTDAEIGDVRRRCIETVESTLPAALRD
jgi:phenylalanyl-tRNA synthetase beta chain